MQHFFVPMIVVIIFILFEYFDKYLDKLSDHPIELAGKRLRFMMWPDKIIE